jgi:hypothetical protein
MPEGESVLLDSLGKNSSVSKSPYDSPILIQGFAFYASPLSFNHINQIKMSPRRPTTRRDSFGLEIREDGTIGFNMSPNEEIAVADSNSERGAERRECEDGSPRSAGSESWRNIVSLTRTKRRRDSFGLEVREDGTLSFDQLTTANVDLKTSGNANRKTSSVGIGDNGLRRTKTQPGRNRRRRDSFGLEIREDGTLSFDQLAAPRPLTTQSSADNSMVHDDGRRDIRRSGTGGQVSNTEVVQHNRIHPTHYHSRNQNHTSNANSATNGRATNPPREHQLRTGNRTGQGRANNVEVEILQERVRVLEAALAGHGHGPHANNVAEQLPAYQSRPCSRMAARRPSRSVTEEN